MLVEKNYVPRKPWSLEEQKKRTINIDNFREQLSMHSVGLNARIVGGNQLAAARDIQDYATILTKIGHNNDAQKYFEQSRRLEMLGSYNYLQGKKFSRLNEGRKLPNRSIRKHMSALSSVSTLG